MELAFSVFRTEKKFDIALTQRSSLLQRLSSVMTMDVNSGSDGYMVRSLYFDGFDDNDYFDKVDGLEARKKIRLRTYSPNADQVKLEIKRKLGACQHKQSMWISRQTAEEMMMGRYTGLLGSGVPWAAEVYQEMETKLYRPKCIIEYQREAFAERTNDIRITMDSSISTTSAYDRFFDRQINLVTVRRAPVLEVKFNGFLLEPIRDALKYANASEVSVSKYIMARDFIKG